MILSKTHKAYFEAARALARLSNYPRVKIGCVITYGHRIISSGFNSTKTDPLQKKYNIYRFSGDGVSSIHAETMALKPLIGRKDIDFKNVAIYVYRENKYGVPMLARPCESCEKLLRDLKIRKCFFSTYGGYAYEEYYDME